MPPDTEEAPPNGSASTAPAAPTITLTFAGPGLADVSAAWVGVTAAQLYGAAWYLDQLAREVRQGQLQQAALQSLAPNQADGLTRIAQQIIAGRRS